MSSVASVVIEMETLRFDIETVDGYKWSFVADETGTFGAQADLEFDHIEDLLKWVSDMAIDGTLAKFERIVLSDNIHGRRPAAR
jgi:hypothetical protein